VRSTSVSRRRRAAKKEMRWGGSRLALGESPGGWGCPLAEGAWGGGRNIDAGGRVTFSRLERLVGSKKRRALRADDVRLVTQIEIDVRVIVRRGRPHALEFLDADHDPVDALVVHEMRYERLSHGGRSSCLSLEDFGEHSDP